MGGGVCLCWDEKGSPVNVAVKKSFKLYCELEATSTKEWLVKNLLGKGEASAFYGAPGSGKSALVEDMGLHIAGGLPWHGRDVMQGAVCYVALERRLLVERRAIAFPSIFSPHGKETVGIAWHMLTETKDIGV